MITPAGSPAVHRPVAGPVGVGSRNRSPGATVAFACAAMLVSYLPFSAVNGVLGAVGASSGVGTHQLQWVTDAFTVALTGAVLSGGVLADRFGPRSAPPSSGASSRRPSLRCSPSVFASSSAQGVIMETSTHTLSVDAIGD